MPCTLPEGEVSGVFMSLCASSQMQPMLLFFFAEMSRDAADGARRNGMISAQNQRQVTLFQRFLTAPPRSLQASAISAMYFARFSP